MSQTDGCGISILWNEINGAATACCHSFIGKVECKLEMFGPRHLVLYFNNTLFICPFGFASYW